MSNTSASGGFLTPISPPPIEDDALADALQEMLVGITGLDPTMVRPRWQAVPPKQPPAEMDWCAVGVMSIATDQNVSLVHRSAGEGTSDSFHDVTLDVVASFYGPNASGLANLLRDGLMIAQNREAMFRLNMALVGMPGPTVKSADLVNHQFITRSDISFDVRRRVTRTWAIQNVRTVNGTVISDMGAASGGAPLEQQFQVTEDSP